MPSLQMLAEVVAASTPPEESLVQSPEGTLAVLLVTLAAILWCSSHPALARVFNIIPALVLCYFVPTVLSMTHVIPAKSALYEWVNQFVLPASLLLLTLSLDVKGILRLGPKAGILMLTGTAGVMLGGPIALLIWHAKLPADCWKAMSYLAGSWIGGSANGFALQKAFGAGKDAIAPLIVVDAALANIWMGMLLYLAGRHAKVDRWLRADRSAIAAVEVQMQQSKDRTPRMPSIPDLMQILAFGLGLAWLSHAAGQRIVGIPMFAALEARGIMSAFGWTVIFATTAGVLVSFTPARSLEGAGASKIGTLMIYLLVGCIGAGADFRPLLHGEARYYLALGATWMLIHGAALLVVARLIRAPLFFAAVASQANIGGAASAPIVAGAFNPVLAPVGVLLAILGYVLGTYGGMISTYISRWIAGG